MGVSVPSEYGGAGMDNVTYVMAMIEISKACASCKSGDTIPIS
ncbi:MAG: acyl-CoA dehydrogenase family protein [Deltaproteobacteria bacterium]|nr:acyl-CoA dehydrogenase family protein [Deltaproteobacteria bacterium]